ncbi:MAG: DUF2203 domain-containing protein [Isosphaera sp.]|nr:DUF2203 domain-containing protein [Isosphaera sp.]
MSSTPNRATNPAGKPRRKEVTHDLPTARQMLPLVKSIVADIVTTRRALAGLAPEHDRLERHRRDLSWLERQRRYQVSDEMAAAEKAITTAAGELAGLGVNLVDDEAGEVDFPTKINGRAAAFTWKLGDDAVRHWHYQGEDQLRPIPADWDQGTTTLTPVRFRGQP